MPVVAVGQAVNSHPGDPMSIKLLDKTRKINKLLHNNSSSRVVFNDICSVMQECLASNVFVFSVKGKVLGFGTALDVPYLDELIPASVGSFIDHDLNERLLEVLSTKENVSLKTLGFEKKESNRFQAIVTPIEIAGERLGTIFLYRIRPKYDIEDIIVCEYGTTVVGLEIMRSEREEDVEATRNKQIVVSAVGTLSYTELKAAAHIFRELNGSEGIIVASKVADKAGITRSVIVNALRKFESAGIIESRSSGMKGTYIKVINEYLFDELDSLKKL